VICKIVKKISYKDKMKCKKLTSFFEEEEDDGSMGCVKSDEEE